MEQMGKFADAETMLRGLETLHPQDPDVLWGLARLCFYQSEWKAIRTQGSPREALEDSRKYLLALTRLATHPALATWRLAEVCRALGDRDQALHAYAQVLREDASYKYAHRYIARLLAEEGRYAQALAKYQQALAIEPDNPELKKEAARVALLAPHLVRKRKQERMEQWEGWTPRPEKPIAPSAVTVRVGIFTGLGHLLFRGESDLDVTTPAGTPITVLKGGEDYQVLYQPAAPPRRPKDLWTLRDREGGVLATFSRRIWITPADPSQPVLLHAVPSNTGYFFAKEEDRAYRGLVEISPHPGKGFHVINRVTLEDYTAGVLPAEMPSSWPLEALKAQAIVARTYVLSEMGKFNADGYDVSDNVSCQVYGGLRAEVPRTDEAVRATAGQVLRHSGRIMPVAFSAQCGGHTQDYEEAWGVRAPVVGVEDYDPRFNPGVEFPLSPESMEQWIKGNPVAWCRAYNLRGYRNFRWIALLTAAELEKKLPQVGRIRRLIVTERSTAGWAQRLSVEGDRGTQKITGDRIRGVLGGIRSNLIWIEPQFNLQGWPEEFIIYGGGWGHGVGMCQVGAYGLAQAGKTCWEILQHYFPEGNVEKLK
jgi:SpoIID/LytB domain protein